MTAPAAIAAAAVHRRVSHEPVSPYAAVRCIHHNQTCHSLGRAFFLTGSKRGVNRFSKIEARSSGGERYLDTVEVVGSNPIVPTSKFKGLRQMNVVSPFLIVFSSLIAIS